MDGPLESLDNLLSMGACNSLVSLKFGLVVYPIFPIIPSQIKTEGVFGLVQLATALVPLPLASEV